MPATIIDHTTGKTYRHDGAAQVAHNWWALLLRGILAILVGIAAFVFPQATVYGVVFAFGVYAFLDGVLTAVAGARTRKETGRWWVLVLQGLLGVAAGIVAWISPEAAAIALLFVVAAWAIVTGVLEIAAAIRLRKEIDNEWLLGLSGLASLILGIAMIANPGAGVLAWMFLFGAYAIAAGAFLIGTAIRLRKLDKGLAASAKTGAAGVRRDITVETVGEEAASSTGGTRVHSDVATEVETLETDIDAAAARERNSAANYGFTVDPMREAMNQPSPGPITERDVRERG